MEQLELQSRSQTPNKLKRKSSRAFPETENNEKVNLIYESELLLDDILNSNETLENEDIDERIMFSLDSPKRDGKSHTMASNYQ